MSTETGNQMQVAFIAESVFGTTPTTPTGQLLRFTNFTLAAEGSFLNNPELRTDRQKAAGRLGVLMGKGELSGVLSYGTYDAFIEAALGGAWTANVVKVGTTRNSFAFERKHLVNTLCFAFNGVVVDSFELSGKANENIQVKFGLISATCATESGSTIWSATSAVNTNAVHTSWQGSVKKGGSAQGNIVGWTLKGNNNYEEAFVVGSQGLYDLRPRSIAVTGTLEIFFDSYALYTAFRAETDLAFQINIGSGSATSYTIDMAKGRITKFGAPTVVDGLTKVTVEFEAFSDVTDTAIKITRIP